VEIHIQTPESTVVQGEALRVDLTLRNTSAETLSLPALDDANAPQPVFVLSGPSFPKPLRFRWHGGPGLSDDTHAHGHPARAAALLDPERFVSLAAGETLSTTLHLPVTLPLVNAGTHQLQAVYTGQGRSATSNSVALKVEAPTVPWFRVVGRTPLIHGVGIQVLSLQGRTLYLAGFEEQRPDLGEVRFMGLSRLTEMDEGATDVLAPWCQTAQPGLVGPRFAWRTGNTVTVAGYQKRPQRLVLGYTPRMHGPSLMADNGAIEILVSDEAGLRLSLLRFPHVGYDEAPGPPAVAWSVDLTEPLLDATASINPAGQRRAVLRHAGGVRLLAWGPEGGPQLAPLVAVPGRPLAGVAPALHVTQAGVVRATVLSTEEDGGRKLGLTELTWQGAAPPQLRTEPPLLLPSPVRSGTVAYSMRSVEKPRRDWVLVLESHRVLSSQSGGKAYASKRRVLQPPQLLVMEQLSYNLELHTRPELNMLR
jgi:hypothetical protein